MHANYEFIRVVEAANWDRVYAGITNDNSYHKTKGRALNIFRPVETPPRIVPFETVDIHGKKKVRWTTPGPSAQVLHPQAGWEVRQLKTGRYKWIIIAPGLLDYYRSEPNEHGEPVPIRFGLRRIIVRHATGKSFGKMMRFSTPAKAIEKAVELSQQWLLPTKSINDGALAGVKRTIARTGKGRAKKRTDEATSASAA